MGRTTTIRALAAPLTALTTLAALTACSGTAEEPDTGPPPPSTRPASPSTSPSPTPPAMPAAARAHTRAGAEAFVRYFWQVVDYASKTLDPETLAALTADDCRGCRGAVDFVREMKVGGAHFTGASTSVSRFDTAALVLSGQQRMELTFNVRTPRQVADYPGTSRDETYAPGSTRARFMLKPVADGWRVVLWETA